MAHPESQTVQGTPTSGKDPAKASNPLRIIIAGVIIAAALIWGGMSLYGTHGSLEITEVDGASGYPLRFRTRPSGSWALNTPLEEAIPLTACPYLTPEHLQFEEPHLYVDIMELVDAIVEDRPCRASGEQGRHVVEIVEAARRAIATGKTQWLSTQF